MKTEQEFAAYVVAWLQQEGWDVYEEVVAFGAGLQTCADIVATKQDLIWVIECKMSMSLALLEQADGWLNYAHMVSVAVPVPHKTYWHRPTFTQRILSWLGIGLITVFEPSSIRLPDETGVYNVSVATQPRMQVKVFPGLKESLRPEHKEWGAKAGVKTGERVTPFTMTRHQVIDTVKAKPGIPLTELVEGIKHHYKTKSSARQAISQYIMNGIIPGLRTEFDPGIRQLRLYPKGN